MRDGQRWAWRDNQGAGQGSNCISSWLWHNSSLWKCNLDSTLKSRDIASPPKVHIVKAMAFPVVMSGCESWTIKKAECQKIDAFELCCWRRLMRVPWTARSNQSIQKDINPEYSLEGLMLKPSSNTLATWCEELTHWKRPWCWERLKTKGSSRGWTG